MNKIYRRRYFEILTVFVKMLFTFKKEYGLIQKKGYSYAQKEMERAHTKRAKELYQLAIRFGGVLIKLCQYFSTKRDMFPEPYLKILAPLQDRVPPVPFESIEKRLNAEYGNYHQIFREFQHEPLAAASLGQVHRAVLKNGKAVVVKVLKYEAEDMVDLDFAILFHIFRLFEHIKFISDRIDLKQVLEEFIRITGDELNFRREIFISKKLRKGLSKFHYLKIPYVYEEYSTAKIIVMEYCEGVKINEISDFQSINCDPIIISKRILDLFFEQFIFIRWVHFDPHPGNILIAPDNRIILLDFGMAGEISGKMRDGISSGIVAFVKKDYRELIRILDRLGFFKKGFNYYSLTPVLEYFFDEIAETVKLEKESIQSVDLAPIMDDLLGIIYTQPIVIPIEWAYTGKTVSALSGIVSILNPNFRLYEEIKPYATKLLKEDSIHLFTNTLTEYWEDLKSVLDLPGRMTSFFNAYDHGNLIVKTDSGYSENQISALKNSIIACLFFILSVIVFLWGISFDSSVESYRFFACLFFSVFSFSISFFSFCRARLVRKGKSGKNYYK